MPERDLFYGTSGPRDAQIAIVGESREIPLTKGYIAYVDAVDYERVNAVRWYANVMQSGSVYAKRDVRIDGRRITTLMHQFVLSVTTNLRVVVNHIDGNGLNNCRANLEVVPQSVNVRKGKLRQIAGGRTSRFRGVSYRYSSKCTLTKCWAVEITHKYEKVYRENFASEVEAACAYNAEILRLFGGDAGFPLNEISDDG